jgi:hypothetical protein
MQQLAELAEEDGPTELEFSDVDQYHYDENARRVGRSTIGHTVTTVEGTLWYIAALITKAVSIMASAVSIIERVTSNGLCCGTIPSIVQTVDTVARPVTDTVIEQIVTFNLLLDR